MEFWTNVVNSCMLTTAAVMAAIGLTVTVVKLVKRWHESECPPMPDMENIKESDFHGTSSGYQHDKTPL